MAGIAVFNSARNAYVKEVRSGRRPTLALYGAYPYHASVPDMLIYAAAARKYYQQIYPAGSFYVFPFTAALSEVWYHLPYTRYFRRCPRQTEGYFNSLRRLEFQFDDARAHRIRDEHLRYYGRRPLGEWMADIHQYQLDTLEELLDFYERAIDQRETLVAHVDAEWFGDTTMQSLRRRAARESRQMTFQRNFGHEPGIRR